MLEGFLAYPVAFPWSTEALLCLPWELAGLELCLMLGSLCAYAYLLLGYSLPLAVGRHSGFAASVAVAFDFHFFRYRGRHYCLQSMLSPTGQ